MTQTAGCQFIGSDQQLTGHPLKFCGSECVSERSYCVEHVHQVYQAGTAQRRRRRTYTQSQAEYWLDLLESVALEVEAEGI